VRDFVYVNSWDGNPYQGEPIALLPQNNGDFSTINVPVNGAVGPYHALCSI
jgi:hypothetical protein